MDQVLWHSCEKLICYSDVVKICLLVLIGLLHDFFELWRVQAGGEGGEVVYSLYLIVAIWMRVSSGWV